MSRKVRIENSRLETIEAEFEGLLLSCLGECSRSRWGLFGQNAHLDPDDSYWTWPEAKRLRTLALEIQSMRSEFGDPNELCNKFLALRELKDADAPGEPKLAAKPLAEIAAS
jgi:hypothetical protein